MVTFGGGTQHIAVIRRNSGNGDTNGMDESRSAVCNEWLGDMTSLTHRYESDVGAMVAQATRPIYPRGLALIEQMTTGLAMAKAEAPSPVNNRDQRWATWMAAAQAGDRTTYETLLRDCIPFIKAVARRQGISPNAIDDVVQETLLTVHRARRAYDPKRSFSAWLGTIAQRRAIDDLRRQRRDGAWETHAPFAHENHPYAGADQEENLKRADHAARLDSAVSKLPSGQREAVQRLAIQEQSLAEVAADTGRSTGALKVNLHRALKTLRGQLRGKD
jgi:RNA polymerase sigma factor (sigma-70 family)